MAAMAMKMTCKNPKNLFCFVCGCYTKSHHKRSIMTKPLIDAYESYFEQRTLKQNYIHGPPSVCNDCNNALLRWANGLVTRAELPFDVPMIWNESRNHQTDCYFCQTRSSGPVRRPTNLLDDPVSYPDNLNSAIKPRLKSTKQILAAISTIQAQRRGRSLGVLPSVPVAQQVETRRLVKPVDQVVLAGIKRKSFDQPEATMYDVTKVRLRSSEPSIVLEQSEKRLPSYRASVGSRSSLPSKNLCPQTATSSSSGTESQQQQQQQQTHQTSNPKITSVFSLQTEMPACKRPKAMGVELIFVS